MIKCLIVDDEPLALDVLENHISRIPQLLILCRCRNALEAFDLLHTQQIDLMFLDIKMPSINGIDFIRSLKNPPAVIFTTAYAEHAITGFELDAIDYLLKPIIFERFQKSVDKFFKIKRLIQPEVKAYTYFKVAGNLVKIMHNDLLIAQSVKDYIHLKTKQGNYLTHMTMKHLDSLLPAETFIRIHRSYIVNTSAIRLLGKQQIEVGGEVIPVGENYRQNLHGIN